MKTGTHPMRTRLQLFLNWGITFGEPYTVPERANRAVAYANRVDLERNLPQSGKAEDVDESRAYAVSGHGGMAHDSAQESVIADHETILPALLYSFSGNTLYIVSDHPVQQQKNSAGTSGIGHWQQ